jgi:hypothetical protein
MRLGREPQPHWVEEQLSSTMQNAKADDRVDYQRRNVKEVELRRTQNREYEGLHGDGRRTKVAQRQAWRGWKRKGEGQLRVCP